MNELNRKGASFILMVVAWLFICDAVAQCADQWVEQISALPSANLGNNNPSLIVDKQGNVLISSDIVGGDTLIAGGQIFPETNPTLSPNTDFFVAKYGSSGDLLWLLTILGEGWSSPFDMDVDSLGNVYVGGIMQVSINVDGVVIERPAESLPQPGYFILKFNPQGQLQWYRKGDWKGSRCYRLAWTGSDLAFVIPYSDSVSIGGEVFHSDGSSWYQDMVFGRLDADGNLINAVNIGGEGNVEVHALACDGEACVLQGRFDRELSYDGTTVSTPAENHFELYQMSIDSSYNLNWVNFSQSTAGIDPRAYGLGLSDDGQVYFSGFYWNSGFTLAGQHLPIPTQDDFFAGRLRRSDGSVVWLKQGDGNSFDAAKCLTTNVNLIWTGGEFYSDVFDYEGSSFTNTMDGENDGFLISLDSNGKPKCNLQLEGFGQNGILQVDGFGDGHVALLGYFNGTIEFGGQTYEALGNYDLLVIRTCLPCDTVTGITETDQSQTATLTAYPNPFTTQTEITYQSPQSIKPTLQLTDMLGRVVQTVQLPSNEGTYTLQAAQLGTGIYFCSLLSGTEVLASQKMVISSTEHEE